MLTKSKRLESALSLLSQGNYWDSVKVSYDIIMNEVFLYVSEKTNIRQHSIEAEGVTALRLMHDFLLKIQVENINDVLQCFRLLTVSFNNYAGQVIDELFNSKQIQMLAINLVGLVVYIQGKNEVEMSFYFGGMPHSLINRMTNNSLQNNYALVSPFFEILFVSKSLFKKDFWEDIELFSPLKAISLFGEEEHAQLLSYKMSVLENQLSFSKDSSVVVEDIWRSSLQIEEVLDKIKLQYWLAFLLEDLNRFRRHDLSSGKYNVYEQEKEKGFHKNIYPFLAECDYDVVLSEMSAGNNRHDIVLYSHSKNASVIVELKVNDLKNIEKDLNQTVNYLGAVEDRHKLYETLPTLGVLAVYCLGNEKLKDINLLDTVPGKNLKKHSDNFYVYIPAEGAPIIIALFNGKE